jgi:hypothetical protein
MKNDPQTGKVINDQETRPGSISKARLVLTGCLVKNVFKNLCIVLNIKIKLRARS